MKKWRYRLPMGVLILGFGLGLPLLGGRLLNAHAWGLPEAIYMLLVLPIFVPPLSLLFEILFNGLVKLANHAQTHSVIGQLNWNGVRLICGIICWAVIMYLIGQYMDSKATANKQPT